MTDADVETLRRSVNRGTPFGSEPWVQRTARRLGLEASLIHASLTRRFSRGGSGSHRSPTAASGCWAAGLCLQMHGLGRVERIDENNLVEARHWAKNGSELLDIIVV